ncbi:MAG: GNAT family N-acetyltransferase [Lachnospiraceae bacterium]
MANCTIRTASSKDAAAIAELCRESLGYACTEERVAVRLSQCDSARERIFVACQDGTVVGFIHAQIYQTLYFDALVNILGLAVFAEARRQGVGTALLRETESWAAEVGAVGIRLNSGSTRTDAHGFYRHAGFSEEKAQIRFLKRL